MLQLPTTLTFCFWFAQYWGSWISLCLYVILIFLYCYTHVIYENLTMSYSCYFLSPTLVTSSALLLLLPLSYSCYFLCPTLVTSPVLLLLLPLPYSCYFLCPTLVLLLILLPYLLICVLSHTRCSCWFNCLPPFYALPFKMTRDMFY